MTQKIALAGGWPQKEGRKHPNTNQRQTSRQTTHAQADTQTKLSEWVERKKIRYVHLFAMVFMGRDTNQTQKNKKRHTPKKDGGNEPS